MQTGGPYYQVELGRLDGKVGTRAVVKHSLPGAGFDLDQLNKLFAANGLTQTDMIALSGTSGVESGAPTGSGLVGRQLHAVAVATPDAAHHSASAHSLSLLLDHICCCCCS